MVIFGKKILEKKLSFFGNFCKKANLWQNFLFWKYLLQKDEISLPKKKKHWRPSMNPPVCKACCPGLYRARFLSRILWCSQIGNNTENNFVKFGYILLHMEIEKTQNPFIFLVTYKKDIIKIWWFWFFSLQNLTNLDHFFPSQNFGKIFPAKDTLVLSIMTCSNFSNFFFLISNDEYLPWEFQKRKEGGHFKKHSNCKLWKT